MTEFVTGIIDWIAAKPALAMILLTAVKFGVVALGMVLPLASLLTWMERRQSAYSQDRYGPQRANVRIGGFNIKLAGLIHVAADGLKMFFKERFAPTGADKRIFWVAPAIGFATALLIVALIPFGPDVATKWGTLDLQIAELDAGLLAVFAIGSMGVYGAALGGWSSNNRFALMGALRASAQTISYEVALGLTTVGVLIAYGHTELSQIVESQGGLLFGFLPNWGLFLQPLGAVLFFVAAMAESKRTPFDLPEGESEIIGYFMEYSSMGFGLFMLGEFVEIVVLGMVFTTLFLGGWQFPWLMGSETLYLPFYGAVESGGVRAVAGMLFFGIKVFFVCSLQLQVRWTLPRFRYDQLMNLGWKNLLPWALVNIFVTAVVVWMDPTLTWLSYLGLAVIAAFIMVVIAGPKRRPSTVAAHGH